MNTGFIFRKDNEKLFADYWNTYIRSHQISPQYLLTNINYLLAYSVNLHTDRSFVYVKDNQPTACVFLPIEKQTNGKTITIGNSFSLAPIFEHQKNIEKDTMENIDLIAQKENVEKIMFRIDPLEQKQYPYNFLMKYNYLDASLLGYLLDCQHITMRRNHRRAVKRIVSDQAFETFIMNKENSDYRIHEYYRKLHRQCAGKITRTKKTFDLQFKLLEEGHATLFGLKYKGQFIAFTYFSHHNSKAVSFSAADDPKFDYLPLYHIINATALNYFHGQGIKEIEMGQPLNTSRQLFCFPDKKQNNISLFKTGFGGRLVEDFRGIKYFSKKAFRKDMDGFVNNYQRFIYE